MPFHNLFFIKLENLLKSVLIYWCLKVVLELWKNLFDRNNSIRLQIFDIWENRENFAFNINFSSHIYSLKKVITKFPKVLHVLNFLTLFIPQNSLKPLYLSFQESNIAISFNNKPRFILYFAKNFYIDFYALDFDNRQTNFLQDFISKNWLCPMEIQLAIRFFDFGERLLAIFLQNNSSFHCNYSEFRTSIVFVDRAFAGSKDWLEFLEKRHYNYLLKFKQSKNTSWLMLKMFIFLNKGKIFFFF